MVEATSEHSNTFKEIGAAARHSAVYSLGALLPRALGFAMLPFYTHYLGPGDYGLVEIVELSVTILGMVLHMGLAPSLLRTYASAPSPAEKDKAVSTVFLFVAATGIVTFLCGFAFIRPISNLLFGPAVPSKYLLLSFSSFVLSYIGVPYRIYLRALEASGKLVLLEGVSALLIMALNIFFIAGMKLGVIGVLLSPLILNTGWIFLAGKTLLRIGVRFSGRLLREIMRFGLPLILSSLSAFVINFADRFFLQHFRTLEVVGIYAVGYKFGFMISVLLVQPFNVMWMSRMYVLHANPRHSSIFGQIFLLYSLALTYAGLAMALLSPEIVHVMAGPKYAGAESVIPVVAFAYVISGVAFYLQTGLYLANQTKLIGVISAIATLITLVLYFYLIRSYGMLGAAWATLLSFVGVAIGSYLCSRRVCPLGLELHRILAGGAIAMALYLPLQWYTPPTLLLAVVVKLIVLAGFPVILWRFRLLSEAETAIVLETWANVLAMCSRLIAFDISRKERRL